MKTKINSTLFLLVALGVLFCLPSCSDDDVPVGPYSTPRVEKWPNLIQGYQEFAYFSCEPKQYDWIEINTEGARLCGYSFKSENFKARWNYSESDQLKEIKNKFASPSMLFNQLAKANNDRSFIKDNIADYQTINVRLYGCSISIMEDITGAKIEALSDFDDNHPAGSSLNDIAYFSYCSFYKFIQSGYQINEETMGGNSVVPPVIESDQYYTNLLAVMIKDSPFFSATPEDIAADPIKCLTVSANKPFALRFTVKPEQACRIRVTFTVKLRMYDDSQRDVSAECVVE